MKNMDRATALVFAWPSIEQDSGITIMFQRPKHGSAHLTLLAAVLCACSLAVQASPTSQEAEEIRSLPSGHWLVLEEDALHLLAPGGRETDQLALRGEGLDVRLDGATAMAVVTDRDSREVIPVSVNLQDGRLTRLAALDTGPLTPEAACLFRDEQGLLHAVVLGQEGFAQQWILHEGKDRLLRQQIRKLLEADPEYLKRESEHRQAMDRMRQVELERRDLNNEKRRVTELIRVLEKATVEQGGGARDAAGADQAVSGSIAPQHDLN